MTAELAGYLEFRVLDEPWNSYRLSDGTVLKMRFVLMKVKFRKLSEEKGEAGFSQTTLITTNAPERLLGPAGKEYRLDEITATIVEPVLGIESILIAPSAYILADGKLVIAGTKLNRVGRSSLYGPDGEPKYRVDFETRIGVVGPVQEGEMTE